MVTKTELNKKEEVYSDFNTAFTFHPVRKDLTRILNEDAVKRSIKNIILTNHYERPFMPLFGANLRKYLFENITTITLETMKSDIVSALNNYEPRANIIDVVVSAQDDTNSVHIAVIFSLINNLTPLLVSAVLTLGKVR